MSIHTTTVLVTRGILTCGVFESLTERVKAVIIRYPSNIPAITCAANLAHHRLLGSVKELRFGDVDLTSVPAEHLASLVSLVTWHVFIRNVRGCDLLTILDSVKSNRLLISSQSLDSEETQALVQLMESVVEEVKLVGGTTLDVRCLMEYSGQGKCRRVECYYDTVAGYKEQLKNLAISKNWTVTFYSDQYFKIERL